MSCLASLRLLNRAYFSVRIHPAVLITLGRLIPPHPSSSRRSAERSPAKYSLGLLTPGSSRYWLM